MLPPLSGSRWVGLVAAVRCGVEVGGRQFLNVCVCQRDVITQRTKI